MSKRIANVVYKYALADLIAESDGVRTQYLIPAGRVVHVAAQRPSDPLPTLWVEHTVSWSGESGPELCSSGRLQVTVVGTGHAFVAEDRARHIGSAVCASGSLVWHIYASEVSGTEAG